MGADALSALRDSYQAVILQSFGVGGVPGGSSGPFARAMEDWLRAGKTIVMMTQVPYEGSDMAVYQVGYQVKEKYQLMEAYSMTLEAAATKLMWILGQTRDPEEVRRLFYQPVLCVLAGQQDLRRDAQALCDLLHSTQSGIALTVQDVPQGGVPDPKLTGEFHQRSAPGLIDQAEVPGKVLVERVCGFQRHCGIISLSGEFGRNAENRMTDPPFRAS